ncbi:MAG: hypothetical protein QM770_07095 [Tepidisphaeraceae bacterium]
MRQSYFPVKDSDLLGWAQAFVGQVTSDPDRYGVPASMAAALQDAFTGFEQALSIASAAITRTVPAVTAKNAAREALKAVTRQVVSIINGQPGVTDAMRQDLRLTVPKTTRTPVPPPKSTPVVTFGNVRCRTVSVRLLDTTPRRGRPPGTTGAAVFTFVGDDPPESVRQWSFWRNVTTPAFEMTFDDSLPSGTTVWVCAYWFNRRQQPGPMSKPECTLLQGGAVVPRATRQLAA